MYAADRVRVSDSWDGLDVASGGHHFGPPVGACDEVADGGPRTVAGSRTSVGAVQN